MKEECLEFDIVSIFNRSITIELAREIPYQSDAEYQILIDGVEWNSTRNNVVSIDGLTPSTDYEITLVSEEKRVVQHVTTKKETALLDVTVFGAKGDGVTDDTIFIQAAINACPKDGTVYFPDGIYYTKPLFLKSDITLWIDEKAELLGTIHREEYPILPGIIRNQLNFDEEVNYGTWEGNPLDCYASLITGLYVENVDIIGRGIINGNANQSDWWIDEKKRRGAWRPRTLFFNHCKKIRIQQITVKNSPSWTVHPYYCEEISLLNVTINNPYDSPNTDGFDPESSDNVLVLGTKISVGDDCIAIKSGKYYMSQFHYKPTKGVTIRNCLLEHGHGCITIGSEVASGVEDVKVSKCIFRNTDRGIRIKTRRGRGNRSVLTKLKFQHVIMENVHMPLTVNMFYFCDPDGHSYYVQNQEAMPVDSATPMIGVIEISDMECKGVDQSFVCMYGLPEQKIKKLQLENVSVCFKGRKERNSSSPLMMDNFQELSGKSFYVRNVEKISINHVEIRDSEDIQPEFINIDTVCMQDLNYIR